MGFNVIDLTVDDCIYDNGFPANIEWSLKVVVQIPDTGQGVVLYVCGVTGNHTRSYLPLCMNKSYTSGIYIFDE